MRALFFGTPEFAVPSLSALLGIADVAAVVCQPDRPAGRGRKLVAPPTKLLAEQRGIEVLQPHKVRTAAFAAELAALRPDVALVVAYGRILPPRVLEVPRAGCVNVHASLLPRWRGAAPIQWAVTHGDAITGVSLMQLDEGMDTGPVFTTSERPINPGETAGELAVSLAQLGGQMVTRCLPAIVAGQLSASPQPSEGVTHAPPLSKGDGRLDFSVPAKQVVDRVRGMSPWPGAFTSLGDKRLRIHRASVSAESSHDAAVLPGTLCDAGRGKIYVACKPGVVSLDVVQLDGKRKMEAEAFLLGYTLPVGTRLGNDGEGT